MTDSSNAPRLATDRDIATVPKVELHVHLNGSITEATADEYEQIGIDLGLLPPAVMSGVTPSEHRGEG